MDVGDEVVGTRTTVSLQPVGISDGFSLRALVRIQVLDRLADAFLGERNERE